MAERQDKIEIHSEHGEVPVETGHLLIVDPGYLPGHLVDELLHPTTCRCGHPHAVLVSTPDGDGPHRVHSVSDDDGPRLIVESLYGGVTGGGWDDGEQPWVEDLPVKPEEEDQG